MISYLGVTPKEGGCGPSDFEHSGQRATLFSMMSSAKIAPSTLFLHVTHVAVAKLPWQATTRFIPAKDNSEIFQKQKSDVG